MLFSQRIKCEFSSENKDVSKQPLLPLCSSMCEHMCECEGFLSGVRRAWSWEDGAFVLVDYIASTGSAYQRTKLFVHRCLRVCFARLPCSCVCVFGQTVVFVCSSNARPDTPHRSNCWSGHSSYFRPLVSILPPCFPLLLPQSFSCSFNFKRSGWGGFLSQHIPSAHTYIPFSSASCLLTPFPTKFPLWRKLSQIQISFIVPMGGEEPVLPKQSKLATDQYFLYFCLYPPPSFCISSSPASPQLESAFTSLLPPSQSIFLPMQLSLSLPASFFSLSSSVSPPPTLSFLSFILFYIFRHLADTHIQTDCLSSSFSPSLSPTHVASFLPSVFWIFSPAP